MNKTIKSLISGLSIILFFNLIISYYGDHSYLINIINSIFLTSLICLMSGWVLFILEKGVLNNFFYSITRFYESISPLGQYVSDNHQKSKRLTFPRFNYTYYLLFLGSLLFCLTLFLSILV